MDELEVARLLEQSRAAHLQYRASVPRSAGSGGKRTGVEPGNAVVAAGYLATAAELRRQANELDPDHTAAAWVLDNEFSGGAHQLETWYAEHLGRVDDPVAVAAATLVEAAAVEQAAIVEKAAEVAAAAEAAAAVVKGGG